MKNGYNLVPQLSHSASINTPQVIDDSSQKSITCSPNFASASINNHQRRFLPAKFALRRADAPHVPETGAAADLARPAHTPLWRIISALLSPARWRTLFVTRQVAVSAFY